MSAAAREYFDDWMRELSRDSANWLAVTATADNRGNDMNVNNVFPSKYIKAADLQGRKLKLTIKMVVMEEVGQGDHKPIIYFEGKDKGLVMNKTKAGILSAAYSPETDGWAGKEVAIFPTRVMFGDQMVDSVGIEPLLPIVDGFTDLEVPF